MNIEEKINELERKIVEIATKVDFILSEYNHISFYQKLILILLGALLTLAGLKEFVQHLIGGFP